MTPPLWTLPEMARAMGAQIIGSPEHEITGVSIDSRDIRPGEAYFAIKGDQHDGHDFVGAALEGGAALAVVGAVHVPALGLPEGPLLVVPDVLEAMRQLAREARRRSSAQIVAVTGSVGKTGTKEALHLALSASGETHASIRSFNNHWGVPLTLARLPRTARFGVFEIGMNHAGEIIPLTQLVRPDVAIVTSVAPVHIEFFSSLEAIADAKSEIFVGLGSKGTAVVPADSPFCALLTDRAETAGALRILRFGVSADADSRLIDARISTEGTEVSAEFMGHGVDYRLSVAGRHWVENSLAVLAVLEALDADVDEGMAALWALSAPAGRGKTHHLSKDGVAITLIDESYNANPASMHAALAVLRDSELSAGGRRIAVLGDMLELGERGPGLHLDLADPVIAAGVDRVYATGPNMRGLFDALPRERRGVYARSGDILRESLLHDIRNGDVVMIKGSLGSKMGPIVESVLERFSKADAD